MMKAGVWNWDRIGMWASGACAVHCVLTGVAIGVLSAVGATFFASEAMEYTFVGLAILAGALAAWTGYRAHGRTYPNVLLLLGFGLIIGKHFAFDSAHGYRHGDHFHSADPGAVWMSILGGTCLIGYHVLNSILKHRASCCSGSV